ncbi:MAG: uracil-DNA glycosylase family protein [Victivallaceae bacterium]|jgi:DNA polymerase
MTKQEQYLELVQDRKKYKFPKGLLNPSEILGGEYDCDHVEPFARWQGNLDAEIFLIGQDFGGSKFFVENKGDNKPSSYTNKKLMLLFKQIDAGIDLGSSNSPNTSAPVFLTNAIVGIVDADGKAQTKDKIKEEWIRRSALDFIEPLLSIVQPKIIIAMGKVSFLCLAYIYPEAINIPRTFKLEEWVAKEPPICVDKKYIFPVSHCSPVNRNWKWEQQCKDWGRVAPYFKCDIGMN